MAIEKKNPNATSVAAAQSSNVFTAINDRDNRIETAAFGRTTKTLSGTSATMTSAELWGGSEIELTGSPSGPFTLTVPGEERGPVKIINSTAQDVTIQTADYQPANPPVIPAGAQGTIRIDGVNVTVEALIRSGFDAIVVLTQAAYDALSPVDASTIYVIVG
jgi:hypothetical protein